MKAAFLALLGLAMILVYSFVAAMLFIGSWLAYSGSWRNGSTVLGTLCFMLVAASACILNAGLKNKGSKWLRS